MAITGTSAGTTNYSTLVTSCPSAQVSLTAPAAVSSGGVDYNFAHWLINDSLQPFGQTTITFNATQNAWVIAIYAKAVEWSVPLVATMGGGFWDALELGMATDATNNFDQGIDFAAPPSGPSGDTVYFYSIQGEDPPKDKLAWDYRGVSTDTTIWQLYENASSHKTMSVAWDPAALPLGWAFTWCVADPDWLPMSAETDMRTPPYSLSAYQTSKRYLVTATNVPIRTLTVHSAPMSGVAITGTPAGTTDYSAQFNDNTSLNLTAPSIVNSGGTDYNFVRWTLNGVDQTGGQTSITFAITADTAAVALYSLGYNLSLKVGDWNLISLPVTPTDPTPSSVFGPNMLAVYAWNPAVGNYFVPTAIESKRGYWVAVKQNTDITVPGNRPASSSVGLVQGWNLVGPLDNSPVPSGGGVVAVYAWDWPDNLPRYVVPTQCLVGRGYWVAATQTMSIW